MTAPSLSTPWRWISPEHGEVAAREVLGELDAEIAEVHAALAADRPRGLDRLGHLAERAHRAWRDRVREMGRSSTIARAQVAVDDLMATDEAEYNDSDDAPPEVRSAVMNDLARWNRL